MKFKILGLAFFILFLLTINLSLAAIPGWPHVFQGTVTFSNGPAISGLLVVAKINGVEFGNTTTDDGSYYGLDVTDPYKNNEGKTITFFVNGIQANEQAIFTSGNHTKLDLTINADGPTPPPTPTVAPSSNGGGGGGGGGRVVTTTTTTITTQPVCGNDICETGEDCSKCPKDCGECPKVKIEIIKIDIPNDITANTPFEISVTVKNNGDKKGSDEITLALPKGWKSDTYRKSVTLDVGQSTILKFTITSDESSGVIAVGSSSDLEKTKNITPNIIEETAKKLPITGMFIEFIKTTEWWIVIIVIAVALIAFFSFVKKYNKPKYEKFKYKIKSKKRK